jgi:hypothetical protein
MLVVLLLTMQVINPTWLAADALLQLASTCSSLTGLYIKGSWSIDSSSLLQDAARHMPQKLQRLVLQRNSNLDLMQLMALLSAQDTSNHNSSSASSGRGGGGSSMLPAEGAAAVSSTVDCCIDCASNSRQRPATAGRGSCHSGAGLLSRTAPSSVKSPSVALATQAHPCHHCGS